MSDRYASLKQGLVGCWIPSVSGSGLLLPDLSGRGNNGALTNMDASDWVSGQYGRALRINRAATRDQVNFGNVCHQPNDFSVSFFVNKIATGSTAYQNLWAVTRWNTGASMGTNEFCCLLTKDSTGTGDEPSFVVDIAGTGYRVESSAALRLGFFDHVCCVRLADTLSIYVNSINRGTTTGVPTTAIANNSRNLKLGDSDIASTDLSTNAMFNDIRIYNRALTETEIRLLASEPGIGFKRNSSAFATRYAYKPAKPRNYSVIRNRDPNYSTLRQGLVAAYCPSISGQGNVLPDLVGGNHGTLTNMTADDWVSSGDGRALEFDGSDDSVKSGAVLPNLTPAFTLSLWVYIKSLPSSGSITNILSTYYTTGSQLFGFDLRFRNDAGVHKLGLRGGDGTNTTELGSDEVYELPTLRWINLLFTVTSSGAIGYQDSIQIATYSTMRGVPMNANKTLSVGSLGAYSSPGQELGRFFNGVMDDIRIYNRALSESEIKLLASKRGIGLEPRKPKITFADLGVQKTYGVVRVKETDYATLRQGLVGAWCPSLPNGGSGNTLPDVSGYGNHGSLVGMGPEDWVSASYGRALDFDGTDDGVLTDSQGPATSNRSVSLWFNTANVVASGQFAALLSWNEQNFNSAFQVLHGNGGNMSNNGIGVSQWGDSVGVTGLNDGKWHHLAVVNTNQLWSIYADGIFRTSRTMTTTPASNKIAIGRATAASGSPGTNQNFTGQLDDIRIYSRALSESEIRLLASRPGIGLRQDRDRNTFYQFPSFQPALARRSSAIIGGGIT